jgi:plasmid stability protein
MAQGKYPSDRQDQYMLRLPKGLREELKERAERNGRSMNAEMVTLIYDGMGAESYKVSNAENSLALEYCQEIRDVQAKQIAAASAENAVLKKAYVAGEHIVYQLANAIAKAAKGDRTELDRLVQQEGERPLLEQIAALWSASDNRNIDSRRKK